MAAVFTESDWKKLESQPSKKYSLTETIVPMKYKITCTSTIIFLADSKTTFGYYLTISSTLQFLMNKLATWNQQTKQRSTNIMAKL
jgi:hypothetical protein